jgi:uncharacterized membrane protein
MFDDDDLLRISAKIKEMEKITSGEIVVSMKERRGFINKGKTIRQLAEREFVRLKMSDTRDRTGIMLYMILKDREFIVLADSGIHSIVGDEAWEKIRDLLLDEFKRGEYCEGIVRAVEQMGLTLSPHFPIKPDDTNEISNKVIVRR